MKRKSVVFKSISRLTILGLVILISTTIVSGMQFYNKLEEEYVNFASSFIKMVSHETGDELQGSIKYFKNLLSFEVMVTDGNNAICVWHETKDVRDKNKPLEERTLQPMEKVYIQTIYSLPKEELESYSGNMMLKLSDGKIIGSLIQPVLDDDNNIIAIAEVDIDLSEIRSAIIRLLLLISVLIIFILAFALEVYFYFTKREVMEPILQLDRATSNVVDKLKNNEDIQRLNIRTNDEIESLSHSFEAMEENLRNYIEENNAITAQQEHIKAELELASGIQSDMLIKEFPPFPEREEFNIYASMTPAKEVGGDFYDFFLIDDNHLALIIADVSGKGVPASLFMMRSMLMIQGLAKTTQSPAEILAALNAQICENNASKMFVTVWLGILDIEKGILKASNAGHEFPIIKEPGKDFELYKDKHGFVVGGKKKMKYKEYELELKPGTKIFVYTDGVPEAKNAEGTMFQLPATVDALNKEPDADVETLTENVKARVKEFVQDREQFDDLTILCFEYLGPNH